jgi:EpsI family protein
MRSGWELLLAVLLIGTGICSWLLLLQPALRVDPTPLESFPYQIDGWEGAPIELDDEVTAMLRADQNVMRVYWNAPETHHVWLYIGYYGTERGGRPEHIPEVCYPSAGWMIRDARELTIVEANHLTADEFVVEREGDRQLVQFWYRSSRRTGIHDGFGSLSDRILNRVLHGRADGALIRISTPIDDGGIEPARERLRGFAAAVERLLPGHWPREFAPGTSPAAAGEPA